MALMRVAHCQRERTRPGASEAGDASDTIAPCRPLLRWKSASRHVRFNVSPLRKCASSGLRVLIAQSMLIVGKRPAHGHAQVSFAI